MEDEYDSEEDEDFKEDGSGDSGSGGSGSGEEDGSDDEESSAQKGSESGSAIDSGVDKEELAEMKKELARQGDLGKRKRRPVKDWLVNYDAVRVIRINLFTWINVLIY